MRKFLMNINIEKDYNDIGYHLHKKAEIELNPGLTVLVGCNGSGKTTLIHQLKRYCDKNKIRYVHYNNLTDGGSRSVSRAAFLNDFNFVASAWCSSEGENIIMNIGRIAGEIGARLTKHKEGPFFIFMDAVDSGLSVDNIVDLKETLFKLIIDDCKNKNIDLYIIISANEYELAKGEQCFNVQSCEYEDIPDYETYRKVILKTRKVKDKKISALQKRREKQINK